MLKWAGGKRQLLPQLRRFYPERLRGYYEPFLGSGAVFFDLFNLGRLDAAPVALTDSSADLIGTYLRIRDATDAIIAALERLQAAHYRAPRSHYFRVRDQLFNPLRARWRDAGSDPAAFGVDLASMLLYLNRTGYNGLFRLNAAGQFNVPPGRYEQPRIVHAERLRAAVVPLNTPHVTLRRAPFEEALAQVRRGDLVYLDPPYAPLTRTANFRSYTAVGFGDDDQRQLCEVTIDLAHRGAIVVLSNSAVPAVQDLYESRRARRAGLRCWTVPARRSINSRGERRGTVEELIVSNREPDAHSLS